MFLAVLRRTVIDVDFQAAIPEVIADPLAIPPVVGVPAVPEVAEVSHEELAKIFLEPLGDMVAQNIGVADISYYDITLNPQLTPLLKLVREKVGPRSAAPAEEFVIVENIDGTEVGRTTVTV